MSLMAEPSARRPLRRVRRAVRPRDAGARVRGARGRVPRGVGRPRVPRPSCDDAAARLRRPAVDPHRVPQPRRASSACACCSSARTSTTPARTRSTTCSARRCWPSGWARRRLVAETGAGQHGVATRHRGGAARAWSARSTWARSTSSARRSTCSACACSAPRSRPVHSGSRTLKDAVNEAMRDWVATVERHPLLPRLGDGPAPVPVDGARVPPGHRRRGPRAVPTRCSAPIPTSSSPASAAARTPWASSPASSTPTPSWSASSRPAARRSAAACPASCTACEAT